MMLLYSDKTALNSPKISKKSLFNNDKGGINIFAAQCWVKLSEFCDFDRDFICLCSPIFFFVSLIEKQKSYVWLLFDRYQMFWALFHKHENFSYSFTASDGSMCRRISKTETFSFLCNWASVVILIKCSFFCVFVF